MSNFHRLSSNKEWPPEKVVLVKSVDVKFDVELIRSAVEYINNDKTEPPSGFIINLLNHEQTK